MPDDDSRDLESITTEPDEDTTYSRQTSTETEERTLTRHTPSKRTLAAVALVGIVGPLALVGIETTWSVIAVGNAAVAAGVAFWLGAQIGARQEATA